MKTFFLIIGLVIISMHAFSQDLIIKKDGERFRCKIISEDSIKVTFRLNKETGEITTFIHKLELQNIVYEKDITAGTFVDSILIEKGILDTRYYYLCNVLTAKEMSKVLKKNELAYKKFRTAKDIGIVGSVLLSAGSFILGWSAGTAMSEKEVIKPLLAIGGGLVAVSIPFIVINRQQTNKAVDIYNNGLVSPSLRNPAFKFGIKNIGISLAVSF